MSEFMPFFILPPPFFSYSFSFFSHGFIPTVSDLYFTIDRNYIYRDSQELVVEFRLRSQVKVCVESKLYVETKKDGC